MLSLLVVIGAQLLNDKILPVNNDLQNLILQMPKFHSLHGRSTDSLYERANIFRLVTEQGRF